MQDAIQGGSLHVAFEDHFSDWELHNLSEEGIYEKVQQWTHQ